MAGRPPGRDRGTAMVHADDADRPPHPQGGAKLAPHNGKLWRRHPGVEGLAAPPGAADGARRVTLFAKVVVAGMALALAHSFFMTHFLQRGYPHNTFLVSPL